MICPANKVFIYPQMESLSKFLQNRQSNHYRCFVSTAKCGKFLAHCNVQRHLAPSEHSSLWVQDHPAPNVHSFELTSSLRLLRPPSQAIGIIIIVPLCCPTRYDQWSAYEHLSVIPVSRVQFFGTSSIDETDKFSWISIYRAYRTTMKWAFAWLPYI